MAHITVSVFDDPPALVAAIADRFVAHVRELQTTARSRHIAVTGGSTGIGVLRAIRAHQDCAKIDWPALHIWWGDERFVEAASDERNDVQADEALFDHVELDPAKIHRAPSSDGPLGDDVEAAAAAYADELQHVFSGTPRFDILMLGVGEEGHTASIFPHSEAARDQRLVCGVLDCPKPPPRRISMTFGTLDQADDVWMMSAGHAKAAVILQVLNGATAIDIPAAGPRGLRSTTWWIDEAAASEIPIK